MAKKTVTLKGRQIGKAQQQRIDIAAYAHVFEGLSQSDAYRKAFPASLKWKDKTVHNRASEFFNSGEVMGRVEALQAELRSKYEATAENVLRRMGSLAMSHIGDYVSWDENGNIQYVASDQLTPEQLACVREVTVTEVILSQKKDETILSRRMKLKLVDNRQPLTTMMRMYGLIKESPLIDNRELYVFMMPPTSASPEEWQQQAQQYIENQKGRM